MTQMKILSISNCSQVESQGSGYAILNFSHGLRNRGHEIDLFAPNAFEPFSFLRKAKRYRQALGMLFFTLCKLNTQHYDIVEFYGAESWLTASILRRIQNRKFLLVSHSNGLETHCRGVLVQFLGAASLNGLPPKWYQFNQNILLEKAFTQVDGIVTVSEYDRSYALKQNYQDKLHVALVEYGLIDSFLNINVDFHRKPIVGYCGSWVARKGIKSIQTDLSQLLTDFPDCLFKIIGVDLSFDKEKWFPPEIISRIEVIPFVESKNDLKTIYQSISIFIVPSVYESFGLVTAEAMACGCAVVANKTGFAANLKHRQEALILDEPVSPFLYESVKELLLNESLRLQIAKAGYQRVQSLRWDLAVDRLEQTYQKWLQELRQVQ
ncbi:MAG: glycosyltransferase family 4 protein [Coleofasciculus sp. G1-WW12-02]|uniref:glycosyltransferase family 4 protein n=1 Tax=Coleofasciculus sp. G1-WW12-02 TaxID=3068483 RepID=UPI003302C05C